MLLEKCKNNFYKEIDSISNFEEKNKLIEAYEFAKEAHEGQFRKSGDAYFTHPLAVGLSLWRKFGDIDLFIAGLLHDTIEDCEGITQELIYEKFGNNVGFIVDSVTKTEKHFLNNNKHFDDERDKMLYGGMQNIGCILVKLADREHNLATLSFMPKHKQVKKSFESQAIYLPLMNILGFNDKGISIEKIKSNLDFYLDKNSIKTSKNLKNTLFNFCFNDFTEDIFDIVYNNSMNVVWELEDKSFFDELVENGWFDSGGVEIQSIEGTSKGDFKANFYFKNGITIENMSGKFNISKKKLIG